MDDQQKLLVKLAHTKMPFGKYEGKYLIDLPEYYLVWIHNNRLPNGQLGEQLKLVYELKLNGLEELFEILKSNTQSLFSLISKFAKFSIYYQIIMLLYFSIYVLKYFHID
jgi:uncharacterized protein (DUF3820 family)